MLVFLVLLIFSSSTAALKPDSPATNGCLVTVGARSFDLSELSGAVRFRSKAAESSGWTYSFSACGGDVTPSPGGASCTSAPPSSVLQQTLGECKGLGAASTRVVAATASGLALTFSGGEGGRSTVIEVDCADVPKLQVIRWGNGATHNSYASFVRARAGCALECARDTSGNVCGGTERGVCTSGQENSARCSCSAGNSGQLCTPIVQHQIITDFSNSTFIAVSFLLLPFLLLFLAFDHLQTFVDNVRIFLYKQPTIVLLVFVFISACAAGVILLHNTPIHFSKVLEAQSSFVRGNVPTQAWSDAMLYTPSGQTRSAWRRLPLDLLAPFTAEAQELLASRQFPAGGCAGARFLVSNGNGATGLGSFLHISTSHLGVALETGRIFLWKEGAGSHYADPESCPPDAIDIQCFLQPPSSCSINDARAPGADTVELENGGAGEKYWLFHVPLAMKELWTGKFAALHRPPPHAMELKYWWRAQATAFLARLNNETVQAVEALRTNSSEILYSLGGPATFHSAMVGPGWPPSRESNVAGAKSLAASFPFERGMISMHVRHGDKASEMTLVADQDYFTAAENLVLHHPMGLARAAFISTEDPLTLVSAEKERKGWTMLWYNLPRTHTVRENPGLQNLPLSPALLTRLTLLQLLMALECDAWVGTRGSNWNRLIDELRCIWVPKCMQPYVDVGAKEDQGTFDLFGWR